MRGRHHRNPSAAAAVDTGRTTLPCLLEPDDRQLSLLQRRAIHFAALGSLLLHAAVLSLPLGTAKKERDAFAPSASSAIRAFLRPEASEPIPVSPPAETAAVITPPAPAPAVSSPRKPAEQPQDPAKEETNPAPIPATFLDPSRLTEKPRPLEEPPVHLLLPMMARPGVANLLLYIDEKGTVTQVEIDSSTLPPAVNERAAALFGAVRFSPGRIDGMAVKTRVRITFGTEERPKQN